MSCSFLKKFILIVAISTVGLNAYAQEDLVFAFDIVRHGDRTPLLKIPNSPHEWAEGMGQLTARGMRQELQRGEILRRKYMEQYHLLPAHFQHETMYVFSTDTDRTLMSAQSLLLGLYSLGTGPHLSTGKTALPIEFQPIPIHTQPSSSSPFIDDADKEKYTERLSQYVITQPEWIKKTKELQALNAQNQDKFSSWSQATGLQLTTIGDLVLLADTLHIYQIHRIPLPSQLSEDDVKEIIETGLWGFITQYKTKEIASVIGSPLLLKISDSLYNASTQKTSLKYVLFSAHDNTILSVMTTLGAPLDHQPPYTSDLNFSLFKNDQGNYIVRVSYNDKPVKIPSCGGTSCTLEQFTNLIGYHPQDGS